MTGIPPPPGMPRDCQAAWYWAEIQAAASDYTEWAEVLIDELIAGADEAGVTGHRIPVAGHTQPVPLSVLLGAYQRTSREI